MKQEIHRKIPATVLQAINKEEAKRPTDICWSGKPVNAIDRYGLPFPIDIEASKKMNGGNS